MICEFVDSLVQHLYSIAQFGSYRVKWIQCKELVAFLLVKLNAEILPAPGGAEYLRVNLNAFW